MVSEGFPAISYRGLALADIHPEMLEDFVRRQEVTKCWRLTDGAWALVDNPHVIDWDDSYRQEIINDEFPEMITSGGALIGAFDGDKLVGFAGIDGNLRGSRQQYVWLVKLHVSSDYRSHGIGRELLTRISGKAKALGGEALYISALSAAETQGYYRAVGCINATELDPELYAAEPYDLHLEYPLNK